eukprot:MONOS_9090.1-p1 / transcript=MONOS_9090.1 / gene=MONOS_9090 / organism=Monocercomonoides_exilis_PA203 / gene_product=unspecified product / transcript_product=unspecified product / location=Mono_scaffold00364:5798-6499(-) / protein_length=181 / sequence_SO=supercontig / SO=protein_coding / is_pseudo=false
MMVLSLINTFSCLKPQNLCVTFFGFIALLQHDFVLLFLFLFVNSVTWWVDVILLIIQDKYNMKFRFFFIALSVLLIICKLIVELLGIAVEIIQFKEVNGKCVIPYPLRSKDQTNNPSPIEETSIENDSNPSISLENLPTSSESVNVVNAELSPSFNQNNNQLCVGFQIPVGLPSPKMEYR